MTPPKIALVMDGSYAATPMPATPMPTAAPPSSHVRHALLPLSLVICFIMVYVLKLPPYWILAVSGPLVALYLAAPMWGVRSREAFDRDAARLLMRGEGARLRSRYQQAWGMRLFAPPAEVAERRGRAESQRGAHRRAFAAYQSARQAYPEDGAPVTVELGLGHASYATGDNREASRAYRAVLRNGTAYPLVPLQLAHALARLGDDLDEAEAMAERALQDAGDEPDAKTRLVRALVHAHRGERKAAKRLLRRTKNAEGVESLREEVETALA
ncbi:MAG: hypothetical protein AB8I08_32235 [Sandaracinaceae bacterium]